MHVYARASGGSIRTAGCVYTYRYHDVDINKRIYVEPMCVYMRTYIHTAMYLHASASGGTVKTAGYVAGH